jgi:hypothetical protein
MPLQVNYSVRFDLTCDGCGATAHSEVTSNNHSEIMQAPLPDGFTSTYIISRLVTLCAPCGQGALERLGFSP